MSRPETDSKPRYEERDHLLRKTMLCYWPEEEREAVVCLVWALHDSILDRHLTADEHDGLPTDLQAASDDLRSNWSKPPGRVAHCRPG